MTIQPISDDMVTASKICVVVAKCEWDLTLAACYIKFFLDLEESVADHETRLTAAEEKIQGRFN